MSRCYLCEEDYEGSRCPCCGAACVEPDLELDDPEEEEEAE